MDYVKKYGDNNFNANFPPMQVLMRIMDLSQRQIRDRYTLVLNPSIDKSEFSEEEKFLIYTKFIELGRKWEEIAKFLRGRTGQKVKNYCNRLNRYNLDDLPQTFLID
jgi:hypothetical protein